MKNKAKLGILEKAELELSASFPIEDADLSESPNVRMHNAGYNRLK